MPNRRPTPDHQEAVSRRLALLSAELAGEQSAGWTDGHTRIRPAVPPPVELSDPPPGPPSVPVPGRHASRREVEGPLASMRGRVALGAPQVAVLAVGVAVALAITCWWLVRGDPQQVEAPVLDPTATSGSPLVDASPVAASTTATTTATAGSVTVDVEGKVRSPGIVVLDDGARVVDALEAAGGARPGVDLAGLNLARVLVDGEQVVVGQPAPPGVAAGVTPTPGTTGGPLVDLNVATATELEALPEVGPVTAAAIVAWRDEHGGFTAVDELLEVDGIGDATLAQLAPLVTV